MYKIYCHTFPNGKKYIGQTIQEVQKRFRNGSGYKNCPYMYKAIQKYGWDSITTIILQECSTQEEANLAEQYYISYYDTTNETKGYNISKGGTLGKYSYELIYEMWQQGLSSGEIQKELSCHESVISRALDNYNISLQERHNRANKKTHCKRVGKYSLNGELLEEYSSITEASKANSITTGHLTKCCKGQVKTGKGYIWKYL